MSDKQTSEEFDYPDPDIFSENRIPLAAHFKTFPIYFSENDYDAAVASGTYNGIKIMEASPGLDADIRECEGKKYRYSATLRVNPEEFRGKVFLATPEFPGFDLLEHLSETLKGVPDKPSDYEEVYYVGIRSPELIFNIHESLLNYLKEHRVFKYGSGVIWLRLNNRGNNKISVKSGSDEKSNIIGISLADQNFGFMLKSPAPGASYTDYIQRIRIAFTELQKYKDLQKSLTRPNIHTIKKLYSYNMNIYIDSDLFDWVNTEPCRYKNGNSPTIRCIQSFNPDNKIIDGRHYVFDLRFRGAVMDISGLVESSEYREITIELRKLSDLYQKTKTLMEPVIKFDIAHGYNFFFRFMNSYNSPEHMLKKDSELEFPIRYESKTGYSIGIAKKFGFSSSEKIIYISLGKTTCSILRSDCDYFDDLILHFQEFHNTINDFNESVIRYNKKEYLESMEHYNEKIKSIQDIHEKIILQHNSELLSGI